MQILHGLEGLKRLPARSVLCVGNFDGLHLGHRRIFQAARDLANTAGAAWAVVTFEPHPLTVLRPKSVPPRLTPPAIKQSLIEAAGADVLVLLPPAPDVLGLSAHSFWQILHQDIHVAHLVEGASFRFGKGAAGTVTQLAQWSKGTQTALHVVESVDVPLLNLEVVPVSSSLIRFLLGHGRVREAAICLGRAYTLAGAVERGFSRGAGLGVPTANLQTEEQLIPPDGVYAGRCSVDGKNYPAAVSIGTMPTFGENVRQIEAHLIGFAGDLYGRILHVEMLDWLRDQVKYAGPGPLMEQMSRDIAQTLDHASLDVSRPIAGILA